jgi:hypothetical protein
VEDTISYITIHLINEENEWYNVSTPYIEDMEFVIRTEELLTGVWYLYLSVTDEDLDTTYLTSDFGFGPQEIRIIPDLLSPALTWIGFVTGVLIGLLVGISIVYNFFKKKFETAPKKPARVEKKQKKTKVKVEKPKKEPTSEVAKEEIQEDIEEPKQKPQRKIKRKL